MCGGGGVWSWTWDNRGPAGVRTLVLSIDQYTLSLAVQGLGQLTPYEQLIPDV